MKNSSVVLAFFALLAAFACGGPDPVTTTAVPTTILFDGKDVHAKIMDFDTDTVFISFNVGLPDKYPLRDSSAPGAGEVFFRKHGISSIFITNHQNDWYQTEEMRQLLPIVAKKLAKFKKVIAYGGSMGGFAALAFSKALKPNVILVFGPQVILPNWPYFEKYQKEFNIKPLFDVETGLDPNSSLFAFYAKDYAPDREAIERDLANIRKQIGSTSLFKTYPLPIVRHEIMIDLQQTNLNGVSLLQIINSDVANNDVAKLDTLFKENGEAWKLLLETGPKDGQ